jgi:hypothetical protein
MLSNCFKKFANKIVEILYVKKFLDISKTLEKFESSKQFQNVKEFENKGEKFCNKKNSFSAYLFPFGPSLAVAFFPAAQQLAQLSPAHLISVIVFLRTRRSSSVSPPMPSVASPRYDSRRRLPSPTSTLTAAAGESHLLFFLPSVPISTWAETLAPAAASSRHFRPPEAPPMRHRAPP